MKNISDEEKLALLGFDDPKHSLAWYKKNYEDLPQVLEDFIIDALNKHNIFPKEAMKLEGHARYIKFYLIIEHNNNNYVVKINNTDQGIVHSEESFKDIRASARYLINKCFTMGGSIKEYWGLDS